MFRKTSRFHDVDVLEKEAAPVKVTYFEGDEEHAVMGRSDEAEVGKLNTTQESIEDGNLDQETNGFKTPKGRKRLIVMLFCLFLVGLALFVTGIVTRQNKNDLNRSVANGVQLATPTPTLYPTGSPQPPTGSPQLPTVSPQPPESQAPIYGADLNQFIQALSDVTDPGLFQQSTPQLAAARWMAIDDSAGLDPSTTSTGELKDRYIASLLFFATNGDEWTTDSNFLSGDSVCSWNLGRSLGILCDADGSIYSINLIDNNLRGQIPAELNYLSQLEQLNLYFNKLTGSIPELDYLRALREIDLDGNELVGNVPESLFKLPLLERLLVLNNPGLTGSIPDVSPESRLEQMSFYNCSLSGSLPESLGAVTSLTFLQFFNNDLTGSIPSLLTGLPALEQFSFRDNQLTGTIPPFNGQKKLETISLGENKLTGSLPPGFDQLQGLTMLYLQGNRLTGTIPTAFDTLSLLERVWFFDNAFEGPVPNFSNSPETLTQLYLNENQFTGTLDNFLAQAPTSVVFLGISDNAALRGSLSTDISKFESLAYFNASNTALTGTIPATELASLSSLIVLSLHGTSITGDWSDSLCVVSGFSTLTAECGGASPSVICECCTECCSQGSCTPSGNSTNR